MRLTFTISSLSCGGAERALSTLANSFSGAGHQVTVITVDTPDSDFYRLDDEVTRVALGMLSKSASMGIAVCRNVQRLIAFRKSILASRPDVVIGFMSRTSVISLISCLGLGIPVIACEQQDPRWGRESRTWEFLRRLTYPRLAALVSASGGVDNYFDWIPRQRRRVIPNPLADVRDYSNAEPALHMDGTRKHIVAMGRLVHQKGFDLLIDAFSALSDTFRNLDLTILGEGPERGNLERLIAARRLEGRVLLPGQTEAPFPILKQADLFVLSSRFEGFGNVLCEAMACGLPVVSFDCPSGPGDIIRDGVDGVLVPPGDVKSLADALRRLLTDGTERERLASRASEVVERFGVKYVMAQWENLLRRWG